MAVEKQGRDAAAAGGQYVLAQGIAYHQQPVGRQAELPEGPSKNIRGRFAAARVLRGDDKIKGKALAANRLPGGSRCPRW